MRIVLPASTIRRIDVLVAALTFSWTFVGAAVDGVQRATGTLRPPLSAGLVLLLIGSLLPWLLVLYGVAAGRRWGFGWMAAFSALGCVGSLVPSVLQGKSLTVLGILSGAINASMLLYGVVRLRQTRVEWIPLPRPPSLRLLDALVGALGDAWMLGVVGGFFLKMPRPPIRADELPFFALLALIVVGYLIAATGVGFGCRWGFVAMVVASAFIVMSEIPNLWMHRPKAVPEIEVAVFSVLALAYCTFRLRCPRTAGTIAQP